MSAATLALAPPDRPLALLSHIVRTDRTTCGRDYAITRQSDGNIALLPQTGDRQQRDYRPYRCGITARSGDVTTIARRYDCGLRRCATIPSKPTGQGRGGPLLPGSGLAVALSQQLQRTKCAGRLPYGQARRSRTGSPRPGQQPRQRFRPRAATLLRIPPTTLAHNTAYYQNKLLFDWQDGRSDLRPAISVAISRLSPTATYPASMAPTNTWHMLSYRPGLGPRSLKAPSRDWTAASTRIEHRLAINFGRTSGPPVTSIKLLLKLGDRMPVAQIVAVTIPAFRRPAADRSRSTFAPSGNRCRPTDP